MSRTRLLAVGAISLGSAVALLGVVLVTQHPASTSARAAVNGRRGSALGIGPDAAPAPTTPGRGTIGPGAPGIPSGSGVDGSPAPGVTSEASEPGQARAALDAQLDAALVNTDSCLEVRDVTGQTIYAHDPTAALAPASTQKLLVAAAALDVLGPAYRFTTKVVAARPPVHGEVDALWLVGGGDPVLSSPEYTSFLTLLPTTAGHPVTTQLVTLVPELLAAGVRRVPGGIHGDDSRYDRTRFLPTWKPSYIQEADVAPLGALEVDDGLDQWHPPTLTSDPAAHAAGVLARLASEAGIAVAQGTDGTAPAGSVVLASVQSPPLADIVTQMLRDSDNTAAEMLTRELDRANGGSGTTAGGVAVVERVAAQLGLPTAGLALVDGSGLSPTDRVTCDTLLDAEQLGSQPRFAAMGLLSVAGKFGTLFDRFLGTPAVGHVEAKTGSIDGVAGLVGRMDEHQPISFAFLINGSISDATGVAYEDRIVAALGTWGAAPPPRAATATSPPARAATTPAPAAA
jgi:D-alanyl-D-alanine carboxypeptidase/D-alanyl-D-alanine-endopeptidase (penicillin-binding protein 4)